MATRRPRFKPTAILSSRRPASTCAPDIKNEPTTESNVKDEIKKEASYENVTQTTRRIIKPSVCLPARKRGFIAVSTSSSSSVRPVDISSADDNNSKEAVALFKSPIMSPSMHVARVESSETINTLVDQLINSESDVNIMSPAKLRQRIRPTPWFGNRRNSSSQNGYLSESDDEPLKRQRHLSTSSNQSIHCGSSNMKIPSGCSISSGRMRTESACSNLSDITSVRETR